MKVSDLMSKKMAFLPHDAPAEDAAKLLAKPEITSILIEDRGKVIGTITDRDFVKQMIKD